MININTLTILPDNSKLILDASVKTESYYTNVYIDKIIIDTQDSFISSGPSSTPVYSNTLTGNNKNIVLELQDSDFNTTISNNIFFIYIITKGTPSSDTPCGKDNTITSSAVYNTIPLYNNIIGSISSLEEDCYKLDFLNKLMQLYSINILLKTNKLILLAKYWKKFFNNISIINNVNICNNG